MQLAQAIDAWVEAHGPSLSASTQRDIADIRVSVVEVGWAELLCSDLDQDAREDILDEATDYGTLGRSAINEFLNLVLSFAESQTDKDQPEDDDKDVDDDDVDDDKDVDDDDVDQDDDEDVDQDEDEDVDQDDDKDVDDDDVDQDEDEDDDDDDDDEDEDEDEDDVDDAYDDDYEDEDEIDHDPEDWVGYLTGANGGETVEALRPENEPADVILAGNDEVAASSFFDAIGASTPAEDTEAVVVLDATTDDDDIDDDATTRGGVFSAAAEHIPSRRASGVDWITVAYFSVAAICFALVIYFYLSS